MLYRIDREKKTVEKMIGIYCIINHKTEELCVDCKSILEYSHSKLDKCPYGSEKPACNKCPTHCYRQQEKDKIKEIMRFSGPKMLSRHPYLAIMHLLDRTREAKKLKRTKKNLPEKNR